MHEFLTAEYLGLTEEQHEALIAALDALESGAVNYRENHAAYYPVVPCKEAKLPHNFNMDTWRGEDGCGTVCCIGGLAEVMAQKSVFTSCDIPEYLDRLFYPSYKYDDSVREFSEINAKQAAAALRNYLTTGEPKWNEVMA
jgi:hypothetical protein